MDKRKRKVNNRLRKKFRVRKKISGTSVRPRLTVYKSLKHVYAQIIDDTSGKTLVSASSLSKEIADQVKGSESRSDLCKHVGNLIAKKAAENKITTVVFDRNGYRYHGLVKSLAESAREAGLKF